MTFDAEALIERRRLRRKASFWKITAALVVVLALVVVGVIAGKDEIGKSHIARVEVQGFISQNRPLWEMLEQISNDKKVAGVVIAIDSPGGSVVGADGLYQALRKLSAKKPTLTIVEGLCASGGYIAALGTDHVIARESSMVGSIGVLIQYPNFSKIMDTVGVKMEEVKSSPLKAAPNGYEPTSPEARAALQALVDDSYGWFKRMVQSRRSLDDAGLKTASDGRLFSANQALSLKLIDELGHEDEAKAWLATKGVAKDLKIVTHKVRPEGGSIPYIRYGARALFEAAGLGETIEALERSGLPQQMDAMSAQGLLALWRPANP